jgi:hypothetical protein
VFAILEALIGLRFFFKLIDANPSSPFAKLVYHFTNLFMFPFTGLIMSPAANGVVLEIPAIIDMFVYLLLAWVIVSLVVIIFARSASRQVSIYERRRQ